MDCMFVLSLAFEMGTGLNVTGSSILSEKNIYILTFFFLVSKELGS